MFITYIAMTSFYESQHLLVLYCSCHLFLTSAHLKLFITFVFKRTNKISSPSIKAIFHFSHKPTRYEEKKKAISKTQNIYLISIRFYLCPHLCHHPFFFLFLLHSIITICFVSSSFFIVVRIMGF